MSSRFDEVEILHDPLVAGVGKPLLAEQAEAAGDGDPSYAPRWRRLLALLTDVSLFAAVALALSPLLPPSALHDAGRSAAPLAAYAAFILLLSFHYFVLAWVIWGRTVGGALFDCVVAAADSGKISVKSAAARWAATVASFVVPLLFLAALLPGGRSFADLVSGTRSFAAR